MAAELDEESYVRPSVPLEDGLTLCEIKRADFARCYAKSGFARLILALGVEANYADDQPAHSEGSSTEEKEE
jgi:hypothetical protein